MQKCTKEKNAHCYIHKRLKKKKRTSTSGFVSNINLTYVYLEFQNETKEGKIFFKTISNLFQLDIN